MSLAKDEREDGDTSDDDTPPIPSVPLHEEREEGDTYDDECHSVVVPHVHGQAESLG